MKNPQTLALLPILALTNVFVKLVASLSSHPVLTGPDVAYLSSRVAFHCAAANSSLPVTYELLRDGDVLDTTWTGQQADQPASFFLKVTETSGGSYYCKATARGSTRMSNSIKMTVVTPPSNTRVASEPFPPVVYEGSRVTLSCVVAEGSHLSYTWIFNREKVTPSSSHSFNISGNKLVMEEVAPEHAGHYACMAWSRVKDVSRFSGSTEVQVTVKVFVSKPKMSFSIFKEGDNYRGNVTCWSSRGSPPISFSLSVDNKEVGSFTATEFPAGWFSVDVVPGLDMGVAQCQVKTEMQELMSDPVTLEVVPVGGDAKVEVEYLYRADSKLVAIGLTCHISRGTFPYVSWLFNDSILPAETHVQSYLQPVLPHYALSNQRRILVLTTLGPEESGYYSCRVRDSYDETGPWVESSAVLVQVKDRILNSMPRTTSSPETPQKVFITDIELITLVFCCFLLLMLGVGVACVYKMFDNMQALASVAVARVDSCPLPALSSPFEGNQADASSAQCDVQIVEITL